jgi:hypothetical protein
MVPVGKEYLSMHYVLATGPTLRSIAQRPGAFPESVSQPNAETVQASDAPYPVASCRWSGRKRRQAVRMLGRKALFPRCAVKRIALNRCVSSNSCASKVSIARPRAEPLLTRSSSFPSALICRCNAAIELKRLARASLA